MCPTIIAIRYSSRVRW